MSHPLRATAALLISLALCALVTCGEEVPLGSGHDSPDGGVDAATDQAIGGTQNPDRG